MILACSLFVSKLSHILHSGPMMAMFFLSANISTSDQRWSDVENETKSDVGFRTLHNIDTTSVSDVKTTSKQRYTTSKQCWYHVDTTLLQPSVDVSESYIESNRASDDYGFANRWIVFILLNEETFLLYINNSTTNEISKHFLTVIRIVTHNDGNNGDIQRRLKYRTQNFKISLKNMKI